MKTRSKLAAAVLLTAGALALTATDAAAYIVCNGEGECWHVRRHYVYQQEWGVVIHPDNWRWREDERYVWREHPGRGYWRSGVWIRF